MTTDNDPVIASYAKAPTHTITAGEARRMAFGLERFAEFEQSLGDGVDAPRRHRRAKVVVLTAT